MSKKPVKHNSLRKAAETDLEHHPKLTWDKSRPVEEILQELQVHQIELDLQNEQLRQTSIELEESRDRYVNFYDFAPVGYLTLSFEGKIEEANLTAAAMLAVERRELKHLAFNTFITPEEQDNWYLHFRSVLKFDHTQTCELLLQRVDGTRFYSRLDCLNLTKNGRISGVHLVMIDITDRKISENSLRIAATAFESQEGMIITDSEMNILNVNSSFTKISGYAAQDVIGKNPRILQSGRHDENFYAEMWSRINQIGYWEGEIWNKRKSGEIYPEHITISAVKDLAGKVSNYVATLTDITMSKQAADEIMHLAFYDTLTLLPNRRLLIDRLKFALASSARSTKRGALLFLDLDNFKILNDTLGHDIGDQLLQQAALRIQSNVREGDTVARQGGDEFVVILEDLSEAIFEAAAQTETIGKKILSALSQPYQLGAHQHFCTISIGATLFGDSQTEIDGLFKQADIAMYQSKKAGRNTLRFFDQQMQNGLNIRAILESELREAIEKNQFELYYQVQVDETNRALGAEALIRWLHPERGLVSPVQFIPVAEETGLILPIGKWVLDTACAQLKTWQKDSNTKHLKISVNVSAKQFRQADFVDQIIDVIQRHNISPTLLKLELTESHLLDNIEETILTMNELSKFGIDFSLDDFGTGYSSLQYLKRLSINQLKIDQSFVHDLTSDKSDRAIVRTIIAMADSLNMSVIAEGVETEEQRQLLLNKGCNQFQGYLFGKPVPIAEFEALVSNSSKGRGDTASS